MRIEIEKAVMKDAEKEMFELKDKKPALPKKVGLVIKLRRKIWQMLQLRQ